ncbi:transposase [Dictyobacter vulcani]|uniref:Transposase n=1 Tax=Dictyobacter vulcani TaxID=2607529 RepID=A0A5J4KWE3_9CHLR|nr:RNA-guided endonuclease TnpB family protein [Dictyobacter vulcani]GER91813.1 transposase [Dictyobacter vulcani]
MQLVEQTVIGKNDPRYQTIDAAAFASKNLYNAALYEVRQSFIRTGIYFSYNEMDRRMKTHEAYKALPAKVAQQVLRGLDKNWKSFFAATKEWSLHPDKFQKRPGLPRYKDKANGRNVLVYTDQAISKKALRKRRMIVPSGLPIEVPTQQTTIDQVRIVPRIGYYVLETVYEQESIQADVHPDLIAGIDIGLNNLATLTANKDGFVPRIVNGRPIKSINQWYNKERARIQSQLAGNRYTTNRLERLTNKRTRKIDHYLHTSARRIIDLLVAEGIGTLIIGKNDQWKQQANMGRRTNQNFVSIPHARFIAMLTYKAQLVGITVQVTEESYTSKCSFLDNEPVKKHDIYLGKRVKRGLFRAADGRVINADVNGASNIIRKVAPAAFGQGSRGPVVGPVRLAV